jgi:hypothetical protein
MRGAGGCLSLCQYSMGGASGFGGWRGRCAPPAHAKQTDAIDNRVLVARQTRRAGPGGAVSAMASGRSERRGERVLSIMIHLQPARARVLRTARASGAWEQGCGHLAVLAVSRPSREPRRAGRCDGPERGRGRGVCEPGTARRASPGERVPETRRRHDGGGGGGDGQGRTRSRRDQRTSCPGMR